MSRVPTLSAETIDERAELQTARAGNPADTGSMSQSVAPSAAGIETPALEVPVLGLGKAIAHDVVHGVPEALSSLLRTVIVALFVLTFVVQPMVIPSESMEHTLLVGDFLLMNRATLAPAGIWKRILPYAP